MGSLKRSCRAAAPAVVFAVVFAASAYGGEVKVLDDFETGVIRWTGDFAGSMVAENAMHGEKAFKVTFGKGEGYPGITASGIDLDWSGYDSLRVDVVNPQGTPVDLTIRVDDDESVSYATRYNGEFLLLNGQTFLEIPFEKMLASGRRLNLSRVRELRIFMAAPERETVLYFDNMRLVAGEEPAESRGRRIVSEGGEKELLALKERARLARAKLEGAVEAARRRGVGTLEANIALITAELGLEVRPKLKWFENRKSELYEYVAVSCGQAYGLLADRLDGGKPVTPVPPIYNMAALKIEGANFREALGPGGGEPVLVFSMLYRREGPLCEYFTPITYFTHTHSFAGASRYDVERAPLWEAYHKYPDTHRVWNGDEGWCGHIVRDSSSLGGGTEPVVVCLESPHTKAAIEEYVAGNAARWKDDAAIHVNIMGGELSYICYCDYTLGMFRKYMEDKYGKIAKLDAVWGTAHGSFEDVKVMPNASQAGANRARWYDWQEFNCYRFVEHGKWAKSLVRKVDADVNVAAGAVSYSVRPQFGRSGVDEEELVRQVDDVVLNEGSESTITTDLLWSFSEGGKAMVDFEYHGDVAGILPHFLHGNAAMAMWWWPEKPDTSFPQFNRTALPYSWDIPLGDVAECLKIGLDVRRLSPQIAAFPKAKAQMAILYSKASMLQVAPEFLGGQETPYTMELKNVYEAMLGLDAPVRFVSSRQVREGKLGRYKVLVVPGATYVYDDVAEAVFDFAAGGGTVVVTPNSLLFDEYARPRDHVGKLGIKVKSMEAPTLTAGELQRDAFLQGMIRPTTAQGVAKRRMKFAEGGVIDGEVEGAGVFQKIAVDGEARVVALTQDGEPGIVETAVGGGRVYYLTMPLVPESMNRFLDAAAGEAGVEREVRFVTSSGRRDHRVEARAVETRGGHCFYIVNHAGEPVSVRVELPYEAAQAVDLRDPWREVDLSSVKVGVGRTRILAAVREEISQ